MDDEDAGPAQGPYFYVGQHETRRTVPVNDRVLQQSKDCGYDMLTSAISTPHLHALVWELLTSHFQELEGGISADEVPPPLLPPFSPSESYLTPGDSIGQVIAFTSPWIDLASPDPVIANISRQILNQEIAYAAFCGIANIVIQGPKLYRGKSRDNGIAQYARAIHEALGLGPYVQLHILMPMAAEPEDVATGEVGQLSSLARPEYRDAAAEYRDAVDDSSAEERLLEAWDAWHVIRSLCTYPPKLTLCLDIPRRLPLAWLQSRWYSEPVRILFVKDSAFKRNHSQQPVLLVPHQALIAKFMRLKLPPWILLSDVGPIPGLEDPEMLVPVATGYLPSHQTLDADTGAYPTLSEAAQVKDTVPIIKDPVAQLNYLRHLQRHQPPKPIIERFGAGYQDYLQAPLQPLTDNLESITYEVFEKDPIKYEWYERAIAQALKDWISEGKPTSSSTGAVVVAVVGAGRGPLVTRALHASANAGVPIELYAVEKNPNAYVLLQRHNIEDWSSRVTVVKSDMRSWRGPLSPDNTYAHVDIIVSELLGSFGDNELSPECLDGVQHVLNPHHGISIPTSYTAHLTPIAAPKLHADILTRQASDPTAPETPHVVMLHAIDYLSTRPTPSVRHTLRATSESRTDSANPTTPPHQSSPTKGATSTSKERQTLHVPSPVNINTHAPIPNVQTCWQFSHPLPSRVLNQAQLRKGGGLTGGAGGSAGGDGANEHNARFWRGSFAVKNRGVCHGLAGYFETVLYESVGSWQTDAGTSVGGDGATLGRDESTQASSSNTGAKIELSTNPETMERKSGDMISWFPIFFPLKTPLYVPDDSELQISMWRQTDDRKVWYEWLVEAFTTVGSRRVRLGVSELHSSVKNGCLM